MKRDESTVRRWEKEGLPVHRHAHKRKATVYAHKSEIDVWWNDGHTRLELIERTSPVRLTRVVWWAAAAFMLLTVGLGMIFVGVRDRLLGRPLTGEITSIAVLPLKNLSGDPAQDYFADGMTEALITELGKISTLQVISHQTVLGYRQTAKPLPRIARDLNVNALLEGTVLRSRGKVRITVNVVQAVPERHLWAESYEFDEQDILAVQGEVARGVARQIRVRLMPEERVRLATSQRVDPEAYEAYLLGRSYSYKAMTRTSWTRAKDYFEKAIAIDPGYAPAYGSLAVLYIHSNRGATTREQEWDWVDAEREYQLAIKFSPSYPLAHIWYAQYLWAMQRSEESVSEAKRAQQLDPVSPFVNTWAGAAYFYAGRADEGMASMQKALELDASFSDASLVLARAYFQQGMFQQAIAALQKALTFNEKEVLVLGALAHVHARVGQRKEALKLVGQLERIEAEGRGYGAPFGIIWAYAGLGDKEQAFAWLEKAYEERRDRIVWLNVDPLLEPLRSDPRFQDLVRRVGLPQGKAR